MVKIIPVERPPAGEYVQAAAVFPVESVLTSFTEYRAGMVKPVTLPALMPVKPGEPPVHLIVGVKCISFAACHTPGWNKGQDG